MIFFDLDGVIRNLAIMVWGKEPRIWDEECPGGLNIFDYMKNHLNYLVKAPPTEYCEIIRKYKPTILTSQPEEWKPYTEKWINLNCPEFNKIIYVKKIKDKIDLLSEEDWLIEDYPNFKANDYKTNIILIDKPYNKHIDSAVRVKEPKALKAILSIMNNEGIYYPKIK